jgi:hypothetical protein
MRFLSNAQRLKVPKNGLLNQFHLSHVSVVRGAFRVSTKSRSGAQHDGFS